MRSITLALFVSLALPVAALAEARFVGFSSATFDGAQGVRTYTETCQVDYLSAARMCTSEEVLNTVSWPAEPASTKGWVRPVYQPVSYDASGVQLADNQGALACQGWKATGGLNRGLAVFGDGRFETGSCDDARPIACCISTPSGVAPAFPAWAMGALSVLLIGSAGWVMATRRRHRPA
jgi:hypothetical protein